MEISFDFKVIRIRYRLVNAMYVSVLKLFCSDVERMSGM
jgi:hypothetical protein